MTLNEELVYLNKVPCTCGYQCPHDKRAEAIVAALLDHRADIAHELRFGAPL